MTSTPLVRFICTTMVLIFGLFAMPGQATEVIEATQIALRGKPHYSPEFTQFDYVNPDAPVLGKVVDFSIGTFDNFNPYATRGDSSLASRELYDDLMVSSDDDLSAYYPLIAEKVRYAADYSFITFILNPKAVFHDGERIKPSDVKFSFEKLTEEGLPGLKAYYQYVEKITLDSDVEVTFHLREGMRDRSRMIALCGLAIFPEHFWKDHRLDEPLKEPPLGSSAYKISQYEFGKFEVLSRVDDYWAEGLPSQRGLNRIRDIQIDYYRDETVAFEAFKAGKIDKWVENTAKRWANDYVFPAVESGQVIKKTLPHKIPLRAQGFVFNSQRSPFTDYRVRRAMTLLMDFEWMNKNLFYGQYSRMNSYFMNTDYVAAGLPSEGELKFLEPIRDKIPPEVFTEVFELPANDGSGNFRGPLRQALRLFKTAGWVVKNQKLVNVKTGKAFEFELLLVSASMEKVALPFQKNLKRAGITMHIRTVDSSQYAERRTKHDFDMVVSGYGPYAYPSPRTRQQWHSESIKSSHNVGNVNDSAIDYLMDEVLKHQTDEAALLDLGKAIDRVLLHSAYIIPQWNISAFRVAYWDKFGVPEKTPKYDMGDAAWWIDADKAAALD